MNRFARLSRGRLRTFRTRWCTSGCSAVLRRAAVAATLVVVDPPLSLPLQPITMSTARIIRQLSLSFWGYWTWSDAAGAAEERYGFGRERERKEDTQEWNTNALPKRGKSLCIRQSEIRGGRSKKRQRSPLPIVVPRRSHGRWRRRKRILSCQS